MLKNAPILHGNRKAACSALNNYALLNKSCLPDTPAMSDRHSLFDQHGRRISYLRVSVTDRCNLRCAYCAPHVGEFKHIGHNAVLGYEEILRLVTVAVRLGVQKVRLTGGEPFVRSGFINFCAKLREAFPALHIAITTNGTLLAPHVSALKQLQLNTLNISLDTFSAEKFIKITSSDKFAAVYGGIMQAIDAGLRVKINTVALKSMNRQELQDFIEFAKKHPVDVRFIEHMPLGGRASWAQEDFWTAEDILMEATQFADLTVESTGRAQLSGPAQMYSIAGGAGRFGVISPVSQHFCALCNRLRLTAEGKLRTCLFSRKEYNLRDILRNERLNDEHILKIIIAANKCKPLGFKAVSKGLTGNSIIEKPLSSIGG